MAKRSNELLGAAHGWTSGKPDHIDAFRERTQQHIPFNWATKTCVHCKKHRSLAQFKGSSTTCRRCPPQEQQCVPPSSGLATK